MKSIHNRPGLSFCKETKTRLAEIQVEKRKRRDLKAIHSFSILIWDWGKVCLSIHQLSLLYSSFSSTVKSVQI